MNLARTVTKYKFDNTEFESLKDLKAYVENKIGEEVIDVINKNISIKHKDLFVLMDILCKKEVREALNKYTTVCFEVENETDDLQDYEIEYKNILDI